MDRKYHNSRLHLLGFYALLTLGLCMACASEKAPKKTEEPQETGEISPEEESRQAWEEKVTQHPWTVSGEYFAQKEKGNGVDLGEWVKSSERVEAKQEDTEKRLAALEEAVASGQPLPQPPSEEAAPHVVLAEAPAAPQRQAPAMAKPTTAAAPPMAGSPGLRRSKMALVVLPEVSQANDNVESALRERLRSQPQEGSDLLLVGPDEVKEILGKQGISVSSENREKIAQALGIYPAARLVLFMDKLSLQREGAQIHGLLGYTVVDGFSGKRVSGGAERGSASSDAVGQGKLLQELLGRMNSAAGQTAAQYPWLTRVAMVEGNRIYLSAGKASGLREGDILAVYGPGREIIHPIAKVSMGFQTGPYKGKIKVVKLFGRDASEADLIAGEGKVEGNDLVAFPDQGP